MYSISCFLDFGGSPDSEQGGKANAPAGGRAIRAAVTAVTALELPPFLFVPRACRFISLYIYIYTHVCVYIYIYIYMTCMCVYIYIYIHIRKFGSVGT